MQDVNNSITVLTWARNERLMMPFFLRHYEQFADKIIVWDNGSEDGTQDIVRAHPKAELREWDTGGIFDEIEHTRLKNEEYKKTGPGWKIVVDVDELLFVRQGLRDFLNHCENSGIQVVTTQGFNMISLTPPEDDGKTLLTDIVKEGVSSFWYDKTAIFKQEVNINFNHGCHKCNIKEDVRILKEPWVKLLHYRRLGLDQVIQRAEWLHSVINKYQNEELKLGAESTDPELQKRLFNEIWNNKEKII